MHIVSLKDYLLESDLLWLLCILDHFLADLVLLVELPQFIWGDLGAWVPLLK